MQTTGQRKTFAPTVPSSLAFGLFIIVIFNRGFVKVHTKFYDKKHKELLNSNKPQKRKDSKKKCKFKLQKSCKELCCDEWQVFHLLSTST